MLRNVSIKRKLAYINAACTILALSISVLGFMYYDFTSFKAKMSADLNSEAAVIGSNCEAALTFSDQKAVTEVLRSLSAEPEIRVASVYMPDGKLFASYTRQGITRGELPYRRGVEGTKFAGDHLEIFSRIRSGKDTAGFLYMESGMGDWYQRRNRFVQIALSLAAGCLIIALFVGSWLQRWISGPILSLARTMRSVSEDELYSTRVTKSGNDEVGVLVDGFNTMLTEIEKRDRELHEANEDLEERVKRRTAELEREIAERKDAEERLSSSERALADFFHNAPVGLHWLAPDGTVLRANKAESQMLGYEENEYVGHNIGEFYEDRAVIEGVLERLRSGELLTRYEARMVCKSGEVKHVAIESNVLWEGDRFVHARGFTRDLTAQMAAEEAERGREEAERANQAKSEFLSRMSHELRTPMNSILGFSQLLLMEDLPSDQRDSAQHILTAGNHLLKLINEVLDISRIESGRLSVSTESVDVKEVVGQAVSLTQPLASQRGITVHSSIGDNVSNLLADRQRLNQVLLNLVGNAIKYNVADGEVRVNARVNEGSVRITVSDTGPGIPVEKQAMLFTPFQRLGAEQSTIEGTGLGLALSKRLVEVMGGTIGLEPSEAGACFFVEFPAAVSPVSALESIELDHGHVAREHGDEMTLLLVEDNLANVKLMEKILGPRKNCRLIVAMQGLIGLELAREHEPDLILLDLNLPDIDGMEVLHRLRASAENAETPVIVVSADATPDRIQKLVASGVDHYLTKPLDVRAFLSILDGYQPKQQAAA